MPVALTIAIKIPGRKSGATRRGLCREKLEKPGEDVNSSFRSQFSVMEFEGALRLGSTVEGGH